MAHECLPDSTLPFCLTDAVRDPPRGHWRNSSDGSPIPTEVSTFDSINGLLEDLTLKLAWESMQGLVCRIQDSKDLDSP